MNTSLIPEMYIKVFCFHVKNEAHFLKKKLWQTANIFVDWKIDDSYVLSKNVWDFPTFTT